MMGAALTVVDGEYEVEETSAAPTRRSVGIVARGTPGAGGLIRPVAKPADVLAAQNETRAMVHEALEEGRDFGTIKGTNKPTLYKAGAERVNAAFAVYPEFEIVEKEIDHDRPVEWTKEKWANGSKSLVTGTSQGLYRYVLKCYLIQRESGAIIGTGVGACSTLESKYVDRPRDLENTVFKMAKKRAYVDATLTAYGLSDEFTQDVEDAPGGTFHHDEGEAGPECPKCGGAMWDNRDGKTNPKAPDFKCKDKDCAKNGGIYWPGEWPPKPEEKEEHTDERARLVAQIDSMVDDIRRIDPTRGAGAATYAAKVLDGEGVTVDAIRKAGGEILAILRKMEAEKEATPPAPAPVPLTQRETLGDPNDPDDLPF